MDNNLTYLDTYILQQDMRIRMPKSILSNLNIERGKTKFNIYLDKPNSCLVLKVKNEEMEGEK